MAGSGMRAAIWRRDRCHKCEAHCDLRAVGPSIVGTRPMIGRGGQVTR